MGDYSSEPKYWQGAYACHGSSLTQRCVVQRWRVHGKTNFHRTVTVFSSTRIFAFAYRLFVVDFVRGLSVEAFLLGNMRVPKTLVRKAQTPASERGAVACTFIVQRGGVASSSGTDTIPTR